MDNDLLIRENVFAELIALCSLIDTEPDLNSNERNFQIWQDLLSAYSCLKHDLT